MAQPSISDVHVDRPLTNLSVAYMQSATNFVADKVFPSVPVPSRSDRYYTYDKNAFFRSEAEKRAPGTESSGSGWTVDNTPTYFCDVFAVHRDVDDQTLANAEAPLNIGRETTEWLTHQLLLKRDLDFVSTYFTTGVWGKDKDGVAAGPTNDEFVQWDAAGSTPIEDITAECIYLAEQTGTNPLDYVLTITPYVYDVLRNHSTILDRIKYTQRGIVTTELMAALFGVKSVNVAWATNSTSAEGEDADMSFVFPKAALLTYSPSGPSLMKPSAGYIFTWTGLLGSGAQTGTRIKNMRVETRASNRYEAEMAYDMKVVSSDCAVYFATAVA